MLMTDGLDPFMVSYLYIFDSEKSLIQAQYLASLDGTGKGQS